MKANTARVAPEPIALRKTQAESLKEQLVSALQGNRQDAQHIVARIEPVIRARVQRVLLRRRARSGVVRDVTQDTADIAQEVFAALLADGGRTLLSWSPERGLSLENFVGLCAEREATSILRSGRRSPWAHHPLDETDLGEILSQGPGVDDLAADRETLERVLDTLRIRLSPLGLHLFEQLYVRERNIDELVVELNMTSDALYAWRSRLARAARKIFDEITTTPETPSTESKQSLGMQGAQ